MTENTPGSVTRWLSTLRDGDPAAAEFLWNRYFEQVARLAQRQLVDLRDRSRDAEDVALSALNALCQAASRGRLVDLRDRHDLWQFLATCTLNRARNLLRDMNRLKRAGAAPQGNTAPREQQWDEVESDEPTPAEANQLADDLRHIMARLDQEDPTHRLREVALWKLEGYSVLEIARRHNCTRKTVVLRLSLIRSLWRNVLLS